MAYLETSDGTIHYQYHEGLPGNPSLVLIHGAGGTHLIWPAELRTTSQASVYALDLPGHGRSTGRGRQSIDAYADLVAEFVRRLDLRRVVLCGHSMGGAITLTIGLRRLTDLAGLILVGTGARLRVNPAILGQIRSDYQAAVSNIVSYSWAAESSHDLKDADRLAKLQADPEVMLGDFQACDRFDAMSQISEIDLPTLVIGGTADQLTPEKYSLYLVDQIPQASFVRVPGGGHMMALEQPELVTSAINSFLATLP